MDVLVHDDKQAAGGAETALVVEGMTCGACVGKVEKALRNVPGVRTAAVNLTTGVAAVRGEAEPANLVTAVEGAGYSARILAGSSAETMREVRARGEEKTRKVGRRLWVGVLAGLPVIVTDMAMPRLLHIHSEQGLIAFSVAQVMLATVVMAVTGGAFFTGAWRAVRHKSANMDVLVALGAGVAYLYSVVVEILRWMGKITAHDFHNEFHAAIAIVVLVTLGKHLEARAKKRAGAAVAGLAGETGATATRLGADGAMETVPAESVAVGDRLQVLAHQKVPVDGDVIEGTGSADLSVVTGESVPVEVTVGTKLPGGSVLADGRIVLRASASAGASTVARIMDLVNAAQASKTHIQGMADRVAGIFVPIVLLLAWANFIGWIATTNDWQRALITTIATIVIACPCAMGLATPTAITVALGTAARMGILFTQASALERAGDIGTVVFDKTGTLSQGRPQVSSMAVPPTIGPQLFIQIAASVEQFSEHPLAKAIVDKSKEYHLDLVEPMSFSSAAGGGVRATFDADRDYAVGSLEYIASLGVAPLVLSPISGLMSQGETIVAVADMKTKTTLGTLGLRDMLRPEAGPAIARLQAMGVRVVVLSGDSQAAVAAALVGVKVDEVRAQVRPEEKAAAVRAMKESAVGGRGKAVAFVGDGINDAPALAAADLGIAMAGGTDLAKSAGDVMLVGNQLTAVPEVVELSRRTMRIIKQNLFWAFAYNVAAIPLAMAGILPPSVAAGAMMISSLTVVGNALRLNRK